MTSADLYSQGRGRTAHMIVVRNLTIDRLLLGTAIRGTTAPLYAKILRQCCDSALTFTFTALYYCDYDIEEGWAALFSDQIQGIIEGRKV